MLLCLNKILPESGQTLFDICEMLSTEPMNHIKRRPKRNEAFDGQATGSEYCDMSQLRPIFGFFEDGSSALRDVIDLYAVLSGQYDGHNDSADAEKFDPSVKVKAVDWMIMLYNRDDSKVSKPETDQVSLSGGHKQVARQSNHFLQELDDNDLR